MHDGSSMYRPPRRIQGVLAADLDDKLRPCGLRLLAPDEGEYTIVLDARGRRLLAHLRHWVNLLAESVDGDDHRLRVLEYEVREFD